MRSAKHDLIDYLTHHPDDSKEQNERLASNIQKFNRLNLILCNELKEIDENIYRRSLDLIKGQRLKNEIILLLVSEFTQKANELGIKFIYCKGLSLAADLYNPIEIRQCSDIDILVGIESLETTLDMLGELGYRTKLNLPARHNLADGIYDTSLINELGPFERKISWNSSEIIISLDLHFGLFLKKWYDCATDTKIFLDSAVQEIVCGQIMWLLELHDRVFHLLVHFALDYTYDRFVFAFDGKKEYLQIHQLHDIALMLDKYILVLDWNKIIRRTAQMQMWREMIFAVRIFNHIYPDRISVDIVNELHNSWKKTGFIIPEQALPMDKVFQSLLTLDPDVLIHTELSELVTRILPTLEYGHPELHRTLLIQLNEILHPSAIQHALNEIIQCHPSLRAIFPLIDGNIVENITSPFTLSLPIVDIQKYASHEQDRKLQELAINITQSPFDLGRGPLVRGMLIKLAPRDYVVLLTVHPSIFDEQSIYILYQELGMRCAAYQTTSQQLLHLITSSTDLNQLSVSKYELDIHLTYWKQKLGNNPPILHLPTDRNQSAHRIYYTAYQPFVLPETLLGRIQALSRKENVSLFTTLLAALKIVLYHYTRQDSFIVGTPITYRTKDQAMIGNFTNILPLLSDLSGNPSLRQILTFIQDVTNTAHIYSKVPFEKLIQKLYPERDLDREPLFRVIFSLQEPPLIKVEFPHRRLSLRQLENGISLTDITFSLAETEQGLVGTVEYNLALFNADTINRLLGHFQTILERMATNLEQPLSDVLLLTSVERHQLLFGWNATKVEYPSDQCLHQLFEFQTFLTPENIALVFEEQTLTYQELNRRANNLAHYLRKSGVKPETLVGICIERSVEMVVGLLGILKAGGAYVPLDPAYPRDRLAFMLEDSQTPILLTEKKLLPFLSNYSTNIICLDADWEKITLENANKNLDIKVKADSLAYIIYTSGSTGKPKGAMNTHKGIVNRLLWMQDTYHLTYDDRILQKTPFSFDVSVWEFFWPLITGARLVVAKPGGHQESTYLVATIIEQKITTVHFVPSMLQIFLKEKDIKHCTSLRRVICSGEALPFDLKEHFMARLSAELHNLYGPTETAVDVTHWTCLQGDRRKTVPIGRPIANTQIYILNEHQNPVPVGVPGELLVGGVGVGRGYLNQPELTKEKFIKDPFKNELESYLYRTGDLVRYNADGVIEFLGRIDHQIKLHGQRVELGEIEAVLLTHPGIQDALVIVREDSPDDQRLVAYIVLRKEDIPMVGDYRNFLQAKLPQYMIPTTFLSLDHFPLLPNGKIDRHALPKPSTIRPDLRERLVIPQTNVEQVIAEIWKEELRIKLVGIYDNFFDLGGDSLLMIRVYNKLCDRLQFIGSLVEMYRYPTIDSLVKYFNSIHFPVSGTSNEIIAETRRSTLERQMHSRTQRKSFRQGLSKSPNLKDK